MLRITGELELILNVIQGLAQRHGVVCGLRVRAGLIVFITTFLSVTCSAYCGTGSLREQEIQSGLSDFVIQTERSGSTSAQSIVNMFQRWYRDLRFDGCSSHSGRRTFITRTARKISLVGGSLRDIQLMAGHSNLQTTQRYIEYDTAAQRKVVDLV
jgi:integrase